MYIHTYLVTQMGAVSVHQTELLLSCPGLRNSSPFTTAVASVFTTHPFRIFTVPFDKYEEPTCLQSYSTVYTK